MWIPAAVLALAVGLIAQASSAGSGPDSTVLKFKTMVGTVAPYIGATNAIRGVSGAGAPWSIDKADMILVVDSMWAGFRQAVIAIDSR